MSGVVFLLRLLHMPLNRFLKHKIPFSSSQEHCGSPANHLPLLPPGPDGVGRKPIAQVLTINAKGEDAEREGFEPSVPWWGTHAFQACTFGLSVISPENDLLAILAAARFLGTEREGFEPSVLKKQYNGFRVRPIQPLSHLSVIRAQEDSNLRPLDPQSNALSS